MSRAADEIDANGSATPVANGGGVLLGGVEPSDLDTTPFEEPRHNGNGRILLPAGTSSDGSPGAMSGDARSASVRANTRDLLDSTTCLAVEAAALVGGVVLASASQPRFDWLTTAVFVVLTIVIGGSRRNHADSLSPRYVARAGGAVASAAIAAMIVLTAQTVLGSAPPAVEATVATWLVAAMLFVLGYAVLSYAHTTRRQQGLGMRPTLIIGAGVIGHRVARRLVNNPRFGLSPVGLLDTHPLDVGILDSGVPVVGSETELEVAIATTGAQHVIVGFSNTSDGQLLELARRCWALGVSVSVVPRLFELQGDEVEVSHLGNLPLVSLSPVQPDSLARRGKYAIERLFALVLLVVLLPLLVLIAFAVRLGVGSPILYKQVRVGQGGRIFHMIKFRSMRPYDEGDSEGDAAWAAEILELPRETRPVVLDRTTSLGRFLRRHSLDELTQLWNVVRGDMALVGPRPERLSYVTSFNDAVYRYGDRHRVKPGLTGWAQVNGLRGTTSLADRVEWDNHYIENWSPLLDLKILLLTVPALLNRPDRPQTRRRGARRKQPMTVRPTEAP